MENKITPELIEKAKAVKTAEELIALAKESNIELTEEQAKEYLEKLNPKMGEISDDELDNVAGGVQDAFNESVHDLTDAIADAGGISTQGTLTKK